MQNPMGGNRERGKMHRKVAKFVINLSCWMPLLLFCYVTKSFSGMGYFHFLKDDMLVRCLFTLVSNRCLKRSCRMFQLPFSSGKRCMPSVYPSPRMPVTEQKSTFSAVLGIPELNRPHLPRVRMTHKIRNFTWKQIHMILNKDFENIAFLRIILTILS